MMFDFQKGRGREGPNTMHKSFAGTIQSGGYAFYGALERDRVHLRRVACWAHTRRKFREAIGDDAVRAKEFITLIALL